MKTQCAFIKEDGSQCRGNAVKDAVFCMRHDPATNEKRLQALQERSLKKQEDKEKKIIKSKRPKGQSRDDYAILSLETAIATLQALPANPEALRALTSAPARDAPASSVSVPGNAGVAPSSFSNFPWEV